MNPVIEGSNVLKPDFGWYEDREPVELPPSAPAQKRAQVGGKKKGQKSEVYAYEPADMARMLSYFRDNGKWIHYLLFTVQTNTARRVGDLIGYTDEDGVRHNGLCWDDFFEPETGAFRAEIKSFCEQKTNKIANPFIAASVRDAVQLYCEKTGCDPSANAYHDPVFLQLAGTHKGKVLSYEGARFALKEAAKACGVVYNVGTHSARKGFGSVSMALHPGDNICKATLQSIYNHSSEAVTNRYIDVTKKKADGLHKDFSDFWTKYVVNGEEVPMQLGTPVISVDTEGLYRLIQDAFMAGKASDGSNDAELIFSLTKRINDIKR